MATSYRAFLIELYEEYLSDGAFVAGQRKNLLSNPYGKWGLIKDWEDRLEAYIDGLCVGGELALDVCLRRALDGEPGEFQLALRVFCRASRTDLIERVISEALAGDEKKVKSIEDAFLHEKPPDAVALVERLLKLAPQLLPVLAKVIGHQRLPLSAVLLASDADHPSVVWALGRLREGRAADRLRQQLRSDSEHKVNTTLALLRIDGRVYPGENWPVFAYGLAGSSAHYEELASNSAPDSSLALGHLGDSRAVPVLISRLPQAEAAIALHLITGAGLIEEQPVEGDDLAPGERPATETKLATDPALWTSWWENRRRQFDERVAYRAGLPYSMELLSTLLTDPEQMHFERFWNAEQLAVRHGKALGFEVDMLVNRQLAALQT